MIWILQTKIGCLGQCQIICVIALLQRGELATLHQPIERVFTDGLQHHKSRFATHAFLLPQQAVVHQRRQPIQNRAWELGDRAWSFSARPPTPTSQLLIPTHRLGRLDSAAADKHSQAPKQYAFARVEQIVAPVDRAAQSLLARREILRAADK